MTGIALRNAAMIMPLLRLLLLKGGGCRKIEETLSGCHVPIYQEIRLGWVLPATIWLLVLSNAINSMASAQWLDLSAAKDSIIEVLADQRIEWQRNSRRLVARGNAKLSHGNVIVRADVLAARYHANNKVIGLTKGIYWLQAEGNVYITSPTEMASGDVANYDMDKHLLILKGHPARLKISTEEMITANKDITYYQDQQMAVARGDVYAITREGHVLRANEIIVNLPRNKQQKIKITQATANGNVRIETPEEVIHGEHGTYNVETDIATLTGSVKITHGENQLNGAYAIFNLKTGQSWLYAMTPSSKRQVGVESGERVKILIVPDRKTDDRKTLKRETDKETVS